MVTFLLFKLPPPFFLNLKHLKVLDILASFSHTIDVFSQMRLSRAMAHCYVLNFYCSLDVSEGLGEKLERRLLQHYSLSQVLWAFYFS